MKKSVKDTSFFELCMYRKLKNLHEWFLNILEPLLSLWSYSVDVLMLPLLTLIKPHFMSLYS